MMVRRFELKSWVGLGVSLVLALLLGGVALADISRGYSAASSITAGSIVALAADGSNSVAAASQTTIDRMIGVVVTGSTITLSGSGTQVQVATDGTVTTLVSTAAGDIKKGDYITLSPIAAVGMKAVVSGRVIGLAQDDFSTSTPGAQTVNIKDGTVTKQVAVGQIPVAVGVTTYNIKNSTKLVPGVVQSFAQSLAGHPVTSGRIYVALIILLAALVSASALLYAAVRTSIIAIGRNPLAKSSITGNLIRVIITVVIILGVAGTVDWAVLT